MVIDNEAVPKSLAAIGAALRLAREKSMQTQGEIGERAGVPRQLVSRIEQGCNGEISAYVSVAAALGFRIDVIDDGRPGDNHPPGLDFTDA